MCEWEFDGAMEKFKQESGKKKPEDGIFDNQKNKLYKSFVLNSM